MLTSVISYSPRFEGFEVAGDVEDRVVVEVEPHDRIGRLGPLGLLLEADDLAGVVELGDSVAFGVLDVIAEDRRPLGPAGDAFWSCSERPSPWKMLSPRTRATGSSADELAADHERLGQAVGDGLLGVAQRLIPQASRRRGARGTSGGRSGVEITRTSRIPASIRTLSG